MTPHPRALAAYWAQRAAALPPGPHRDHARRLAAEATARARAAEQSERSEVTP